MIARDDPVEDRPLGPDTRGISEVVAFVLIFAIILGSVGFLYTTGFGAMNSYQENEQQTNAVRAMESLTDNFNDVMRSNGVNERYGELTLRGGTIATGDGGTELEITTGDGQVDETIQLGEFAYEDDGEIVAYEGGALIRADDTGSVPIREPQFTCRDRGGEGETTAVVSLVSVTGEERSFQSSSGTGVTMSVEEYDTTVYDEPGKVTITADTDNDNEYGVAWESMLGDDDGWTCGEESDVDRLVLTVVDVEVTL